MDNTSYAVKMLRQEPTVTMFNKWIFVPNLIATCTYVILTNFKQTALEDWIITLVIYLSHVCMDFF